MAGSRDNSRSRSAHTAHAQGAEHIELVLNLAAVLALGVSSAEDAVPEQGHLFLERALSVDHPVGEIRLVDFQSVHFLPVNEVALEDMTVNVGLFQGREEFFDGGFVAVGRPPLDFLVGGAKPGAAHEVSHKLDILVGHECLSCLEVWPVQGPGCKALKEYIAPFVGLIILIPK